MRVSFWTLNEVYEIAKKVSSIGFKGGLKGIYKRELFKLHGIDSGANSDSKGGSAKHERLYGLHVDQRPESPELQPTSRTSLPFKKSFLVIKSHTSKGTYMRGKC